MSQELEHDLDRPQTILSKDIRVFTLVDEAIEGAVRSGDPTQAFRFGKELRRGMQTQGLGLAKLLSGLQSRWEIFSASGMDDTFEDAVWSEVGLAVETTRKYVGLWRNLFENEAIQEDDRVALMGKPIKSLLLLSAAARDGDIQDWKPIIEATDHHEIRSMVRQARGEVTSSTAYLQLVLGRDGTITARVGDEMAQVGYINLSLLEPEGTVAAKGIQRIVERSGMVRK